MLTLADVEATLKRLAGDRPIFHSEDDFQHALDRAIRGSFPRVRVQLEQPLPLQDRRGYADLWLRTPAGDIVLELKYWTQALRTTVASEEFSLRAHSANDLGRYDLIKDLVRIEHLVDVGHAGTGAVIAITNDHLYWTKPNRQTTRRRLPHPRRAAPLRDDGLGGHGWRRHDARSGGRSHAPRCV